MKLYDQYFNNITPNYIERLWNDQATSVPLFMDIHSPGQLHVWADLVDQSTVILTANEDFIIEAPAKGSKASHLLTIVNDDLIKDMLLLHILDLRFVTL